MNLHGIKRDAMTSLTPDRKGYLLSQNRKDEASSNSSASASSPETTSPKPASFISLSAGTSLGLTRLLPQLTGGSADSTRSPKPGRAGWTHRLSIASIGSWTGVTTSSDSEMLGVPQGEDGEITPKAEIASLSGVSEKRYGEAKAIERQYTGGLWGWWTGGGKPEEGSPAHFVEGMRDT